MNAKHTQGPWRLNPEAAHPWVVECDSNIPECPATVCVVDYRPNARLIAAAPELLEALTRLVGDSFQHIDPEIRIKNARAAITKATGE